MGRGGGHSGGSRDFSGHRSSSSHRSGISSLGSGRSSSSRSSFSLLHFSRSMPKSSPLAPRMPVLPMYSQTTVYTGSGTHVRNEKRPKTHQEYHGAPKKKPNWDKIMLLLCIAIFFSTLITAVESKIRNDKYVIYPYSNFVQQVEAGEIKTARIGNVLATGEKKDGILYQVNLVEDENLVRCLIDAGVEVSKDTSENAFVIFSRCVNIAFMVWLIFFMSRIFKDGMMRGKAKYKKFEMEKSGNVGFDDVAGQEEAKESLEEIVDFLKNKGKYAVIGARLPKGALLIGPPGTGKTLLAKAVATEAGVPFFSISGSDFVELFVGMGASRVRNLFEEAKKNAPSIIFIDEIDAIAGARDGAGSSEREQTLNQLLTEMDGFGSDTGIVVLGATNRPESLDPAILRPGRFDRRIIVDLPDVTGREAILKVHAKPVKMDASVCLRDIAQQTSGVSGADIANIVNEAAIAAVKDGRNEISQIDLIKSIETVLVGKEKKGSVLNEVEKRTVACHEIGHALVAAQINQKEPIQKISIIPHTQGALGYVLQAPAQNSYLKSKEELLNEITILLSGRAAEETFLHTVSTGASNDLEKATKIAKDMVTRYGFGDELSVTANVKNKYLGAECILDCSQSTMEKIEKEVSGILKICYQIALKILSQNGNSHQKLMEILIQNESLTGTDFMKIVEKCKHV